MKIKDVISCVATLLNLKSVGAYLDSLNTPNGEGDGEDNGDNSPVTPSEQVLSTVSELTKLTNLVISELSASYIPIKATERVTSENGKILFSALSHSPTKILGVFSDCGEDVFYVIHPSYIALSEKNVDVEYAYSADSFGLTDEIGYTDKDVSARVLAYGVCAEYSLCTSLFDEAVCWRKRFNDEIMNICLPKSKRLKKRSWF